MSTAYYFVNGITLYRLIAAPVLVLLIFTGRYDLFKWLLAVSFFTDLIDGYLARKFKVTSRWGSRLDSIGDDLTIVAAVIGVFKFKPEFIASHATIIIILLGLFLLQIAFALVRYGKISSFHTYLAKLAAILQGSFLILIFFLPAPVMPLFYAAAIITALDLIEEMIMVIMLPKWETDVKGIYWIVKRKRISSR